MMSMTPQEREEWERETQRIQKIVDKLVRMGRKHDVPDFVEALACVLGTCLMVNGGLPALAYMLNQMLEKGKQMDKEMDKEMDKKLQ